MTFTPRSFTMASATYLPVLLPPCRKKKKPKQDAYLGGVSDRKLKGQLQHTERLYKEANKAAATINQWLAPSEAGFVEAEGEGLAQQC